MVIKHCCLVLLGCLGLIRCVYGQQNNKSSTNFLCDTNKCSCCLENAICNISSGLCGDQCKDGYHGGRCKNECPGYCLTCKDVYNPTDNSTFWDTANCTKCESGYYSTTDYFQCQSECPVECEECTSASDCTSCKPGYYLSHITCYPCPTGCAYCTSSSHCTQCKDHFYLFDDGSGYLICLACSSGCQNGVCDNMTGICVCNSNFNGSKCDTCVNGRYGTECKYQCKSSCASCISVSECTSCKKEYILQGTTCQTCKTGCAECSSPDTCIQCKEGYYMAMNGKDCTECSAGCKNKCSKSTGSCNCRAGFTGEKCDQCAPNFQTYPNCSECASQYHGAYCNMSCPSNCKNKTCDKYSGACTMGCVVNFSGNNCTLCMSGFYGTDCSLSCSDNCLNDTCDTSTGYCHYCKSNYMGNMCNSCIAGQYGDNCDVHCPPNCKSPCQRSSGKCDSCNDGFSGDKCCLKGTGCRTCSSDFTCLACVVGLHGERCDQKCPTNCAEKICDKLNGTCSTCSVGFYGDNCTLASTGTRTVPSFSVAALGGGVIGGVVALIAVGVILFICFKRRSVNKKNTPSTMARTDDLTTDRVYANDAAIIAASKGTNTYDTITDMTPPSLAASWKKREAKPLSSDRPDTTDKLDESLKSSITVRLDTSLKPDKQVQAEMAVKPEKQDKASQSSKTPLSLLARMDNKPGNEPPEDEDDNDYYNSEASPEKGIPVSGLAVYVDKKDSDSFNNEYAKLPKGLVKSTDAALLDQNLSKNRYNAIYPYDETRVVLAGPGSDFINACYIEGYRKKRRYIASLGPIAKATEGFKTFWRMVWQEKTEKVVMVTNLMESGGMKCEQYWPDKNVTLAYGDVKVTCHSEDVYAEYTVRSFTVRKKKEQRSLHHIHYTAWPDKGVPDDVTSLVEFRNKVNSTKTTLRGPIIVHCSAGVGRTGTYIALDILTLKGERTGFVDIFECVSKLRQQRTCMVQTAEQYEYLHRALVHTLTFESEAISADHFMAYTASLRDDNFDRLSYCTEKISTEEMEAIDRNKAYAGHNRPGADIPGDNNRPRLYYGRTTEDNDYINALFVNSFKRKNQFILTQTPLPNTVDDFLTLVVQESCCCIVSMDAADIVDKTIGTYLPPDNQTLTTDTYEVRIKKLGSNHIFSQRTLTITSKNTSSTVTVQHFRCTNWSDNDKTPKSPSEFLTLIKQIQKVADETTQFSPIIIHCRTGSERSALPCVVLSLLQKIEIEHEVSVINTVRQVKVRRSKSIPNKEQFKFCHQCVSAYLQTFDIYSNFS